MQKIIIKPLSLTLKDSAGLQNFSLNENLSVNKKL